MYYKIRNDIFFRRYDGYGYITDNSEFGYRLLNDNHCISGEKYVSESGAIMIAALGKTPRHIDDIMEDLSRIFVGVDSKTLKQDTIEFFQWLVESRYLSFGETLDSCQDQELTGTSEEQETSALGTTAITENCSKNSFSANDFLRSIHIDLTSACNERCVHCYMPHECDCETINPDLFARILEEGREMNIINVTLSGGEPLLHSDFLSFLVKCRELDVSVNVLSNLTLLTDDIISEMKKNPLLSVQTSLYSMDASVHDSITKLEGSLKKTKSGLLQLVSAGIPVQISCPVMKQNKDSFLEVIQWGRRHCIAVAVEPMIFAAYDHSGSNLANRLSLGEIEEAVNKQLPEGYAEMMREIAREKEKITRDAPVCSICRYKLCISPSGDVFPCVGWQTNTIGNLKLQSLREIWETSEKIQNLRQMKWEQFPLCVVCEDRGYCTVCMMCNSNENPDGDAFRVNDFRCKVAAMIHRKVDTFFRESLLPEEKEPLI